MIEMEDAELTDQLFECGLEPNWWDLQNRFEAIHSLRSNIFRSPNPREVS